jgi:hypothetical protein
MPSWWDKKKHEWLYKSKMRKHQKQAQKYAKMQKKMAEDAAKRATATSPTASARYAEWKRQRQLKKEKQAAYWAKVQEKHPFLGWIKKHETKFFWLATICVVAAVGLFVTREMKKAEQAAVAQTEAKRVMVRVNDKPIYIDTLLNRLFFTHGSTMLQAMTEEQAVKQAAEANGVELSGDEREKLERLVQTNPKWQDAVPRLEMSFLLKKLILKDVNEDRRKEVFRDFEEDLVTYSFSSIWFDSKKDASSFLAELATGGSLEKAAVDHSIDGKTPEESARITRARFNRLFGLTAEKSIRGLKPGEFSQPLYLNGKYVVFRLDEVFTRYEDVRETIDSFIVQAETQQYMYRILSETKVESPFIDPENALFKADTPGPFETPSPSPTITPR